MTYSGLLENEAYSVCQKEKEKMLLPLLEELTDIHRKNCVEYARFLKAWQVPEHFQSVDEIPMLPVGVFKKKKLCSVKEEEVFQVLASSGTGSGETSRIYLDQKTAQFQQLTLFRILEEKLGRKRIPMLIIDSPSVLRDKAMFSARGAGILGFSIMSSARCYALDEEMNLKTEEVRRFLKEQEGKPVLVFGFTFMVWKYFYEVLRKENGRLPLEKGILFHGGGWKKMTDMSVSAERFKEGVREVSGIERIYDYYGMAEQTGSIYVECEQGHLHASTYSDIRIRRAKDFGVCRKGEEGIVQVLSPMAYSYPGHSILTQDKGILLGIDDCSCGRKGAYFHLTGRIPHAQVRGCSDTYGK